MKSKLESQWVPPIMLIFYSIIATVFYHPSFKLLTAGGITILSHQLWQHWQKSRIKWLNNIFLSSGLTKTIEETEIYPKIIDMKENNYCYEVLLSKPPGISSEDFEKKKLTLSEGIGKELEFENKGKYILMKVYKNNLKEKYIYKKIDYDYILEIPVGISNDGPVSFKFNDQFVHLLVGGTTGMGKGNFIIQMLTNLILTRNSEQLKVYIIDLKKAIEAQIFKDCQIVQEIAETEEETFKLLCSIEKEMHRRYELFKKSRCININNYKGKLPRYLVIIDELANLRTSKRVKNKLIDLLAQTRAVGIHFILSTQRPDNNVIDGLIKANTQATLALNCRNKINSMILLDNDNASRLNIPGRAIFQMFKDIKVQVYYLSEEKARFLLKPFYITKEDKKINKSGVSTCLLNEMIE